MSKIIANQISPRSGDNVTINGNLSVGGTVTYEDVSNVDSVGIVTAGGGIIASGIGISVSQGGVRVTGVVTATSFSGDGSGLSGVGVGVATEGGVVGTAVTLFDFRGSGISTITFSSGIATIFIEGGTTLLPPVINSVGLTTTAGANRFTSQDFTVATTMVNDGIPVSQKSIKSTVTASLKNYTSTDTVTNVTEDFSGSNFPSPVSPTGSNATSPSGIVYIQDPTSGLYYWIAALGDASGGNHRLCSSTDGTNWNVITQDYDTSNNVRINKLYQAGDYIFGHGYSNDGYAYGPVDGIANFANGPIADLKGFSYDGTYYYAANPSGVYRGLTPSTMSQKYTYSGISRGVTIAGNGVIIALGQSSSSPYPTKVFRSTDQGENWTPLSDVATSNSAIMDFLYFNSSFYFVIDNRVLYKSSNNGTSWNVVNTGYNQCYCIGTDGKYLYSMSNAGSGVTHYLERSTNNGTSWSDLGSVSGLPYGVYDMCFGGGRVGVALKNSNGYAVCATVEYGTQTLTLNSNSGLGGLNGVNVSDLVRTSGSSDYVRVTALNTSTPSITIAAPPTVTNGETLIGSSPTSTSTGTKYLTIDSSGNVTDIVTADPGFVQTGPGTSVTLTFPATFPSGDTPDVALPAGASIRAEIQATNSQATDTELSNIVTPT